MNIDSKMPEWLSVALVIVAIIIIIKCIPLTKTNEGFKYAGASSGYIQNQSLSAQAARADTARVIPGKLPPGSVRGMFGVDSQTLHSTHPQAWRTTIFNTLPATSATVFS